MITYDQLSKIFREQLKILFPGKHISSNEAKSKDMESYEMQFHVVIDPEEPHLIIGFTKEKDSSMIDIWNGKRMNKVIDIDIDDGFIRRYHEPQLYAESSSCLGYSQVSAIYTALDTFLNCDDVTEDDIEQFAEEYSEYPNSLAKKKHPLQNSPTFTEEESVEEKQYAIIDDTIAVATEDKTWMKSGGKFGKPIDPFKMVPIFNTEALETNAPYIIKNLENNTMGIVTLRDCSSDYVVFGLWNDDGEYIVEEFTVSEFYGAFELYTTNNAKVEL